ncbi:MAG: phosphoribosylglycinamide formyltransferase [Rhodothermales bacterium]|nr:phosphoribosylglycinamide formyltransferase [Rhodothermales bacterium]
MAPPNPSAPSMQLAVFASGGGSNFQAMLDAIDAGRLNASVALCISNKESAGALERARDRGIATLVLDPKDFADSSEYDALLLESLEDHGVTFVALAGYLRQIPSAVVEAYRNRIVNIHPALLPSHGGPGMYGRHVHRAVLERGDRFSGATVHIVDEDYDTGPIVLQDTVPVQEDETAETLAARVLKIEHRLYPAALQLFSEDRVRLVGRRVLIDPIPDSQS